MNYGRFRWMKFKICGNRLQGMGIFQKRESLIVKKRLESIQNLKYKRLKFQWLNRWKKTMTSYQPVKQDDHISIELKITTQYVKPSDFPS